MGLDLPSKLRQVIGLAKDHASIGKAIVRNYNEKGFFDIEVAVVRATSHDDSAIDDKTMHEILFSVSNTPGSVPFLAEQISRRLAKTRDCFVALKALLLIHRLLRGGSRVVEQQLLTVHASGHLQMESSWFLRNSDPSSGFLKAYTAYLQERVEWIINQSGKLEPNMSDGPKFGHYKEKSMDLGFRILPKCQEFIEKVLNCSPVITLPIGNLVQAAICTILKESFQVYMLYSDSIAALVNMFFDLSRPGQALACKMLRKAAQQSRDLHNLYEKCRGCVRGKSLEYPSVPVITMDHVIALEQCSSHMPKSELISSGRGTRAHSVSANLKDGTICNKGTQEMNLSSISLSSPFSFPMETKISTDWVVFEDEEQAQVESFNPVDKYLNLDHPSPS